jgi:lipopolysaccharide transport system ATP-binding protein
MFSEEWNVSLRTSCNSRVMNEVAIRVSGLGKRYRIHHNASRARYRTLREDLMSLPQRWLGALRSRRSVSEEFWALRDISFEVERGEVLGVIGRNGAGKSTLLKILSRISDPSEGCVDLYGRVGSLLEVGTGFHTELSGRENIFLSGALIGMRRHEVRRRFEEIVAFAEVERFIDEPVKHYSSGMYARLAFAVAAHLDTEILLIDEVLSVGDVEFQRRCLDRMRSVARDGRTVLFVSHNMTAVRHFCTQAMLIERGSASWWGTKVDEAVNAYFASGAGLKGEWRNATDALVQKNPWFALESIRVINSGGGTIAEPVDAESEIFVEICGSVIDSHSALCVGFAFYSEDDTALYWSYQTDANDEQRLAINKGKNVMRARLPIGLLNEGRYRIDFLCGLHCIEWIVPPRSGGPSVQLEIKGVSGSSSFRLMRRPVLLAPVLSWEKGAF